MIRGLSIATYTLLHTVLSLVGIVAGLVVAGALATLLTDRARQFDQVVLSGHSLGSVIAYDTVNELLSRVWATQELSRTGADAAQTLTRTDLEKLRGLVTFGSPLDKVCYFYREHVASDEAVRAQILLFLYSLLRRSVRSGLWEIHLHLSRTTENRKEAR